MKKIFLGILVLAAIYVRLAKYIALTALQGHFEQTGSTATESTSSIVRILVVHSMHRGAELKLREKASFGNPSRRQ